MLITFHVVGHGSGRVSDDTLPMVNKSLTQYRNQTTTIEQLLLTVTMVLLPLENYFPVVAGFSSSYIMFAVLAGYIFLNRPRALARVWSHPVFLTAYTLLIIGFLMEFSHPYSSYEDLLRIGQMFIGAIIVASLCRDRRALYASIYSYLIAGVWISIFLFLTTYSALRGVTATNFQEASLIRVHIFPNKPLDANLNELAFFTAQGAIVALALSLTTRYSRLRDLFLGITLFCLVATFLTFSRAGVAIAGISFAIVAFIRGVNTKTIITAVILGIGILVWAPSAVFSRLSYSTQTDNGKMESRARIYTAAVEHFSEYVLIGVGAGNFFKSWGYDKGWRGAHDAVGAHNCFIQVTVFWGLPALLTLIAMVYQAYYCLPRRYGGDVLVLYLYGIATSLLLEMLVTHNFYGKAFSVGFGLLVGARCWIWPRGVVQLLRRKQNHHDSAPVHAS